MRAFHGQFSDNQPIRRNVSEKQKQLRDLRETLAAMKAHTAPALRDSVRRRIAELEVELRGVSSGGAPSGSTSSGAPERDRRQMAETGETGRSGSPRRNG